MKDYSYVQNQLSKTHLRHQVRLCTLMWHFIKSY